MNPPTDARKRRQPQELISSNGIAREIGRSTRGVIAALVRLNIHPVLKLPAGNYYGRDVIERVRDAMRAPNNATTSTPTGD